MTSAVERARAYLAKLPPAISGEGGHTATFRAANACLHFDLDDGEAMALLLEYNGRCEPEWTERELRHKLNSARLHRREPVGCKLEGDARNAAQTKAPEPKARHLSQDELRDFVALCGVRCLESELWLHERGLTPEALLDADVPYWVLPYDAKVPSWAQFHGRTWTETGHRFVVPLWDSCGVMRNLHARSVRLNTPNEEKAASPAGVSIRGLVMTNKYARRLFAGEVSEYVAQLRPWGVIIVEGVPDWLRCQVDHADTRAPAIVGVIKGSWTQAHADAIPDGARVLIATHADHEGDKYAAGIKRTLAARVAAGRLEVCDKHNRQVAA